MINYEILKDLLKEYKETFVDERWENEKFKWEAVKHFQDNWSIEADDFLEMFWESTAKGNNLLTSMNNFPRGMIKRFAEVDEKAVKDMFIKLYDETQDVGLRIEEFSNAAETLRLKYGKDNWNNHYQNLNSISTYLWLRYPDKYYIYKYSVARKVSKKLESDADPKTGTSAKNFYKVFKMYNEVCEQLKQDKELIDLLKSVLTEDCYPDPELKTLSIDVCYYINQKSKIDKKAEESHTSQVGEKPSDDLGKTGLSSASSYDNERKDVNYWWLNASPQNWSFGDAAVGEIQDYTLYNDNGNKRRIFQNFLDAKKGDLIIGYETSPTKQVIALAEVTRENDGKSIYFKKTENLTIPIGYSTLKECPELKDMQYFTNPQGSMFKLTKEEYEFILNIIRTKNFMSDTDTTETYSKEDFLDEVYITEEKLDTLTSLLNNKKNLILQGAPGVGKTFASKRLAYAIMGEKDDDRIELIQFHQNYSYEDFIMGYRPEDDSFVLKEGIFYKFCKKASNKPDKDFFFIIDEINRGNMSKIFGELLMLVEKDYRGTKATLAYNSLPFSVPENIYIIGMMNTADRSLAMIDYALRRRFSFFEIGPGFDSKGFKKYQKELDNEIFDMLIESIKELNKQIADDNSLGRGFKIGHSYFCGQKECTDEWMMEVVEYDIIPMLSEYWFDEEATLESWKSKIRGVFNG